MFYDVEEILRAQASQWQSKSLAKYNQQETEECLKTTLEAATLGQDKHYF